MKRVRADKVVQTRGTSMLPLVRTGTRIGLKLVPASEIALGDLVAFESEDRTVVHRVIDRKQENGKVLFREKGDSNVTATWIHEDQVLGKAIWSDLGGLRRRLDLDPSSLRLRLLVRASRIEANLLGCLVRAKRTVIGSQAAQKTSFMGRWLRWAVLPVKVAVGPFLLSVYGRRTLGEAEEEAELTMDFFRAACGMLPEAEIRVSPEQDWEAALESFGRHGLIPLLVPVMDALVEQGRAPAWVGEQLRQLRYQGAFKHMSALGTTKDIVEALGGADVPFLIIKGPALSLDLYTDTVFRTFGDVDVLVKKEDLERAVEALTRGGFHLEGTRLQQALVRRGHFHIVLKHDAPGRPPVELHWSLVDRANLYRIRDEEVFTRSCTVEKKGLTFSTLSPEDNLVYLALHAVKHGVMNGLGLESGEPASWFCLPMAGNRLTWYLDLHFLLERHHHEMNWELVKEKMRAWNTEDEVVECLRLLEVLLPGSQAHAALERWGISSTMDDKKHSWLFRLFKTKRGREVIERSMVVNPDVTIRPVRLLLSGRIFFPPPSQLLRYYGVKNLLCLPVLYLVHPFNLLRKQIA